MKLFFANIKKVLAGEKVISQQDRMEALSVAIIAVHLIFIWLFAMVGVWPLILYNILVVSYYLAVFRLVKEGSYLRGYSMTFGEIVFQEILASLLVGWGTGFYLYVLAIVPMFHYIGTVKSEKQVKPIVPFLADIFVIFVTVAVCVVANRIKLPFDLTPVDRWTLFGVNLVFSFFLLAIMSFFFVMDSQIAVVQLNQENEVLEHTSSVDPLTGLNNRRSMEVQLDRAMDLAKTKGKLFSLIMGDIDNFKRINDTYGHECGDMALTSVSEIFRASVREDDTVCRWGGEEFLVLISGNQTDAVAVAERMRSRIEAQVLEYQGNEIRFTMTFGVMTYVPGYSLNKLIQFTDENLYKGKTNGKNQVVYKQQ
ncbi:MAG: GGDEF domain-containing protein [Lachnospiraceae bacterium]|nr:GGDEF domain-containing protein [Lachnospiraceae bacterium]